MHKILIGSATFIFATPALWAAEPDKAPVASASVQQRFDAAKALRDTGKSPEAFAAFASLESDITKTAKPGSTNLALIRAFRAGTIIRNEDKPEDIQVLKDIVKLPAIESATLGMAKDEANYALSFHFIRQLDDAAAAEHMAAVRVDKTNVLDAAAILLRRSVLLAVLDPVEAERLADEAIALLAAVPKKDKVSLSSAYNAKGRAQLNQGAAALAKDSFAEAIKLRGGLDLKIDYSEFSSRSDAAIASLRLGDKVRAKELLAYTGAGRTKTAFMAGRSMPLPPCGGNDAISPDDWAIIEFSLERDGSVSLARPVIASRAGPMSYAFARTAREWNWNPEAIKALTSFQLRFNRVEVRCSNATKRPTATSDLRSAFDDWMTSKNPSLKMRQANETPEQLIERANQEAGAFGKAWALTSLSSVFTVGKDKQRAYALEAEQILRSANAPASIWLVPALSARTKWTSAGRISSQSVDEITQLLNDPALSKDAKLFAQANLVLADHASRARDAAAEEAALKRVSSARSLAQNDPLKIAALIGLANLASAKGDTKSANDFYDQTGLSARQCAALDNKPVMLRTNADGNDFPMEALRWGFDGWVRNEFDIAANGKTENVRMVISYPPSVFRDAGEAMAKDFQYRERFRPDGGLGCGGNAENISFTIDKRFF